MAGEKTVRFYPFRLKRIYAGKIYVHFQVLKDYCALILLHSFVLWCFKALGSPHLSEKKYV